MFTWSLLHAGCCVTKRVTFPFIMESTSSSSSDVTSGSKMYFFSSTNVAHPLGRERRSPMLSNAAFLKLIFYIKRRWDIIMFLEKYSLTLNFRLINLRWIAISSRYSLLFVFACFSFAFKYSRYFLIRCNISGLVACMTTSSTKPLRPALYWISLSTRPSITNWLLPSDSFLAKSK